MIEFRKATIADIPVLQDIANNTWYNTFGEVMPREQIAYMLEQQYNSESLEFQLNTQNHNYVLICLENIVVGYVSYELNYKNTLSLMIHKAYILPDSQGHGIGRKLFYYLTDIGVQLGQGVLRLKVFHLNHQAIGFYEKIGFVKTGTEKTDIGNDYVILDNVMERNIIV